MQKVNFVRTYDHYSPATFVRVNYKGKPITLKTGVGTSDHIAVFKQDKNIILLTFNYRYDYLGIEVFYEKELDDNIRKTVECGMDSECFWQSSENIKEALGLRKDWTEYSLNTLARYAYSLLNQMIYG